MGARAGGQAAAGPVSIPPGSGGPWALRPLAPADVEPVAELRELLTRADERGATVRLTVLQGSPARRLYERYGFAVESEDPVDVLMARPPAAPRIG